MISPLIYQQGNWKIVYADDVYIDVFIPSIRNLHLESAMLVDYEIMWIDVNCYANVLKIVNYELLSYL